MCSLGFRVSALGPEPKPLHHLWPGCVQGEGLPRRGEQFNQGLLGFRVLGFRFEL